MKDKHDCVIVYGKSALDSKEMTCGEHLEIEYVIASLKKFCQSWCGRIFVVGSEPPESVKSDVIHIPCDDPYTHCKDANIIHKLRYACENIGDLTDDFLMVSDDQIVTKVCSWEDMRPRYVRKYTDWSENKWNKNRKIDHWHECLYRTLTQFPKEKSFLWEPHIWSPLNKYKFIEMCKKYDYENNIGCIVQSLYYNYIEQKPVLGYDNMYFMSNRAKTMVKRMNIGNLPTHLAWTDKAFEEKKFRDILDKIVGFVTQKVENEVKNVKKPVSDGKYEKIMKLREDIRKGNVVKVSLGNGKFAWKRIK